MRFIQSKRGLAATIGALAIVSWVPALLGRADPWFGLSTSLFASCVFAGLTLVGVDVLLTNAARHSVRSTALRETVCADADWIFRRLYEIDPKPFDDEIPGIRALAGGSNLSEIVAAVVPARGPLIAAALRGRPLPTLVEMADAAFLRLDAIRTTTAEGKGILSAPVLSALRTAASALAVLKACANEARPRMRDTHEDSAVLRVIDARTLSEVLVGCLGQIAIAYNASRD